jgi:hypothetical protein
LKGDSCSGWKNSKERITVLFTCSVDETDKLAPLGIGKSENPHCFKNVLSFPTKCVANRKAWVTQAIFTDYLGTLDAKTSSQNRKFLLFIDGVQLIPKTQVT